MSPISNCIGLKEVEICSRRRVPFIQIANAVFGIYFSIKIKTWIQCDGQRDATKVCVLVCRVQMINAYAAYSMLAYHLWDKKKFKFSVQKWNAGFKVRTEVECCFHEIIWFYQTFLIDWLINTCSTMFLSV